MIRPHLIRPLLLTCATALAVTALTPLLRAQNTTTRSVVATSNMPSQPSQPSAGGRPNLRSWEFAGTIPKSDHSFPHVATLTGYTNVPYAEVFDFYAKKIGGNGYDLRDVAEFKPVGHSLISSVSVGSDLSESDDLFVGSDTMHATFCERYDHSAVSVFLLADKGKGQTTISLTETTF